MERALVLGANGLIGQAVVARLGTETELVAVDRQKGDITDRAQLLELMRRVLPTVVVNCAGFLNADRCEREPDRSYQVNAVGPANVVWAIQQALDSRPTLVHFSSDFVFDGQRGDYTEADLPAPLNRYGMHKWIADELILRTYEHSYILRVASVIGLADKPGFITAVMRRLLRERGATIVGDLRISVATVDLIVSALAEFLRSKPAYGLYNCVAQGEASWFEIAEVAMQELGIPGEIRPISVKEYSYGAPRPINSTLNTEKISSVVPLPSWSAAVRDHLRKHRAGYEHEIGRTS